MTGSSYFLTSSEILECEDISFVFHLLSLICFVCLFVYSCVCMTRLGVVDVAWVQNLALLEDRRRTGPDPNNFINRQGGWLLSAHKETSPSERRKRRRTEGDRRENERQKKRMDPKTALPLTTDTVGDTSTLGAMSSASNTSQTDTSQISASAASNYQVFILAGFGHKFFSLLWDDCWRVVCIHWQRKIICQKLYFQSPTLLYYISRWNGARRQDSQVVSFNRTRLI